jgi:hypothetical protein
MIWSVFGQSAFKYDSHLWNSQCHARRGAARFFLNGGGTDQRVGMAPMSERSQRLDQNRTSSAIVESFGCVRTWSVQPLKLGAWHDWVSNANARAGPAASSLSASATAFQNIFYAKPAPGDLDQPSTRRVANAGGAGKLGTGRPCKFKMIQRRNANVEHLVEQHRNQFSG